jgi:rhamnogalacturonyl hydrolase YesR
MKSNQKKILLNTLLEAEKNNYSGYSKFDALNSPELKKFSLNNKWLRLIYTQLVKESPFNLRPFLKVKKSRNPKGIALFARAYLFLYQHSNHDVFLKKAEALMDWLLDNPSPFQKNLCWGYNFIWQNTIFLQDQFEPNAVVSSFVGESLIHAYQITHNQKYLSAAVSLAKFMTQDLPVLYETKQERAIAYVLRNVDAIVLNNQVLTGAFLSKVGKHTGHQKWIDIACRQINYTVNKKTDYHAWYYTYPSKKSYITHDNYHTGGILDGLLEYYEATCDDQFMEIYWKGLNYYQYHLFESNGAPRWMNNRKYPFDIHGAAQGIITFKKASRYRPHYIKQADKIADWTIQHLYRKKTHDFAYRKSRFFKWNYSLMRWCNAWISRALAQ